MSLRRVLRDFVKVVVNEAEQNPEFAEQLRLVFEPNTKHTNKGRSVTTATGSRGARPANRRPPPVLDPVSLAAHGKDALHAELAALTLDQLKDIVADYGMDHDKLVMKWKTKKRVIDRIVEVSIGRSQKGDAFR